MANALPRALETFSIPFTGGRHRTSPLHFGRLKMASALEPNGGRLSASFDGGQRKITFSAKAEHNNGGNSLDEGPQGGGLDDDLLEYGEHGDDEDIFKGGYLELESVMRRHASPKDNNCVNIWWDSSRCPPPSNFDISKIGITIIDFLEDWSDPVYLHVYGNLGELLPKMVNDTIRIFSQSDLNVEGFEVKDNSNVSDFILAGFQQKRKYFSNVLGENLMMDDLIYYEITNSPSKGRNFHKVVLDGKVITTSTLYQHRLRDECLLLCLLPEQESTNGVWRWKRLDYWE